MNYKNWKDILNEYTRAFENCRYDHITKDADTYISDIMSTNHQVKNSAYRSFGTYRHDILSDTSIIKINETKISEKNILENYYANNADANYIFSGIVLNPNFAANSNEASLEDLFAEFGYDYLVACDSSAIAHNQEPKYFEQTTIENGKTKEGGYYEIVPIGNKFYEKNERGEDVSTLIEYDGQYCPTVNELLSGELYIVIKSGELKPQKIYFNNKFLPTLFINDDKYPNNMEMYILDNQQTLKLCDLCLFQKLGCQIIWDEALIIINNIQAYKLIVKNQINSQLDPELQIKDEDIYFQFYFLLKVKLDTESSWHYVISNIFNIKEPATAFSINKLVRASDVIYDVNNKPYEDKVDYLNLTENYNIFLNAFNNNNATGKMAIGTKVNPIPHILLDMYMGVALFLNGFTTNYQEQTSDITYQFYWYDYIDISDKYKLLLKVNDGDDYITNLDNSTKNNQIYTLNIENDIIPSTYDINMTISNIKINEQLIFELGYIKINTNIEQPEFTPFSANDIVYFITKNGIQYFSFKLDKSNNTQQFILTRTANNTIDQDIIEHIYINNLLYDDNENSLSIQLNLIIKADEQTS